jgi:putative CocE/NonD family hydrolase
MEQAALPLLQAIGRSIMKAIRRTALACCCVLIANRADPAVIVEPNVPVPMRDGVILRADVHRPSEGGPFPVLLMRTPYGKGKRFDRYVEAGYIVVCQDARGRYASDGQFESFLRFETHDAEDGYDSVEWAARLPNSTGKVGTFGASYNAFLQWRLAALRPPSLVAMSAQTIPARYTDLEGPGTIRPGRRLKWWFSTISPDLRRRAGLPGSHTPAEAVREWEAGGAQAWLHFLPWLELPREAFEDETRIVQHWLRNPHLDPWQLDAACQEIAAANLDIVGWHDHCNGDLQLFKSMVRSARTEAARTQSKIVIGPWSHSGRGKAGYGDVQFGPRAKFDLVAAEIRWFDYWLKGQTNGVDRDPPVRLFVMGDNQWRDEPHWPLERARPRTLYLASGGQANTPAGDGRLVDGPFAAAAQDRYDYDPRDPVPSLHGPAQFTIPTDQRPLAKRKDILVYQSDVLRERVEVTGNPVVELYASSSAPDTDFFVRLIDVAPSGLARDVSLGMVRARYRRGLERPAPIAPGQVVKYTIRMNPTSNAFLRGHRIRLDITSSDFPNYDRNHNTAADQNADASLQTARQTIFHGAKQATRIILPWVPAGDE